MTQGKDNKVTIRIMDKEYVVGCPEGAQADLFASLEEAQQLGERIRSSLEKTRLIPELSVTVSAGIAALHENEAGRDWIRRADNALYRAKHEGRNRICIEH